MNRQRSKYFSTALLMDEALIYLLSQKEIQFITVKEICQRAGVHRSTFYLHYESIDDLLEETLSYINKRFIEYFGVHSINFAKQVKSLPHAELKLVNSKYLSPYLAFIKENKNIFRATFGSPNSMRSSAQYNSLKKIILLPILERFSVAEEEREFLLAFYIEGIMAVIKRWVQNGCQEDINYIAMLITKYVER